MPGRGSSTDKELEVRRDQSVVGEWQDPEDEWRGGGKDRVTEKRAKSADPAEACSLRNRFLNTVDSSGRF